jgi:ribosome maturation factor RimP
MVVAAMAERVAAARGLELVEVQVGGGSRAAHVRVFVDKPGGIAVDDLQALSVELSALLDASDPIAGAYRLEVSSPGLDRPLRGAADFRRNCGRLVAVQAVDPDGGQQHLRGRIVSVDDEVVTIEVPPEAAPIRLPIPRISQARIEVELQHGRPRGTQDTRTRKPHG